MEYIKASAADADGVFELVQKTVSEIYPRYYPKGVVDFFCALHNKERIAGDMEKGNVGVLRVRGQIVGTGSSDGNHITRVYVLPEFQGKGYGSYIMQCMEEELAKQYASAVLDASLPAAAFYERRGYRTVRHERCSLENKVALVYEVMQKALPQGSAVSEKYFLNL